jgi:single-stranded-DNA-specific exonuclease
MSSVLAGASFSLDPCSYDDVRALQEQLGCSETLAWVLVRRGISADEARALFAGGEVDDATRFHDPLLMGDMPAAVERIRFAIDNHETIVIHGDYDADGVCSTALLAEALEALGADVRPFLPNRFDNGYGLQMDSVERFALDGARLLICVDCGITAVEPVAQALDRNLDVIVCDHHRPGDVLPAAIIASSRPGPYPFPDVCATVVVGKLVQALGAPYGPAQHELEAIATIADCMPLVDENRHIVRRGLAALRHTKRPGIKALLACTDTKPADVDAETVAFRIAPRLNAAGRLGDSDRAYELLRATDATAPALARELHDVNDQRRAVERDIVMEAEAQIATWSDEERAARAWVVSGRGWHEGVVGIVASRLVEKYYRPVIVIADQDPLARGSGRSVEGFDLHAAITQCADLLVRSGGHTAAIGLTIEPDRISELRVRLAAVAEEMLGVRQLAPVERVDAIVSGDELTMALIEEIEQLAPFGTGNERPRLLAVGARLSDVSQVGEGKHLKCRLNFGGVTAPAIGFNIGADASDYSAAPWVDACVRVSVNRFRGAESLQLQIDRLIPAPEAAPRVPGLCAVSCTFDCSERVGLDRVLANAPTGIDLPGEPPSMVPVLARTDTVDLRHRNRALAHMSRLASAGARQLIVTADVSRRRDMLTGPLQPHRLGVRGAALASSRCSELGRTARLHALSRVDGSAIVLTDYGALAGVLDGPVQFDAVVVLDPPLTENHRDLLVSADCPVHLIYGATEMRFSENVGKAIGDVRGTLGAAWRTLRDGAAAGEALERILFGDSEHLRIPEAVMYGLGNLAERGFFVIGAGTVTAVDPARAAPAAS